MQPWLISVVLVTILTMTLLFLLSFDSLEPHGENASLEAICPTVPTSLPHCAPRYQEFGLNCNYLSESVEKAYGSQFQ